MKWFASLTFSLLPFFLYAQIPVTRFEKSNGKETATYPEIIRYYQQLDKLSNRIKLFTKGPTDAGYPLHLATWSNDGTSDPKVWKKQGKLILFIINGIHPGEPDGIDASMMLLRDLHLNKINIPDQVAIALIPVYNIGGCLNRSPYYRVDQNGPDEFGWRGNSQNLDLNRDFIKSDSREARSFAAIFHELDPDIFIDNHVSNGADYQHVMTVLTTQHNKLGSALGDFLNKEFEPALYAEMKNRGFDLAPYVNIFGDTPEQGWTEFYDGPRYSSGYAALWHCLAFVPETHMLKPYPDRVKATYAFMETVIRTGAAKAARIRSLRMEMKNASVKAKSFPIQWKSDRSVYTEIQFKGYESGRKPSEVSGHPRLYYDRNKPFTRQIKFYNTYSPSLSVTKPKAYILPQGWWKVSELLRANKVIMRPLMNDTTLEVDVYKIENYRSSPRPFEGHHLNSDVQVSVSRQKMNFRKGDLYIPMNQEANRFIMEVLEPQAPDSYFAWNFFDPVLTQKEGYSSYVFEETAAEYLKVNPQLKDKLEQKKTSDSTFAKSGSAQLNYIYENSPYFEPAYLRYPVYRVPED